MKPGNNAGYQQPGLGGVVPTNPQAQKQQANIIESLEA
jgi:hypothetical protein